MINVLFGGDGSTTWTGTMTATIDRYKREERGVAQTSVEQEMYKEEEEGEGEEGEEVLGPYNVHVQRGRNEGRERKNERERERKKRAV